MEFPAELRYTEDHEWIRIEGNMAFVGITDYAQSELGEIVYVEVETVGDSISKQEVFGAIEAVKTTSDLFMPISGTVVEFNDNLEETPELVNEAPYGGGWIVKIEFSDPSEIEALLDTEAYQAEING